MDFIAGWCGGLTYLAVCHPFDTIKVRLQASHTGGGVTTTGTPYRHSCDVLVQILRGVSASDTAAVSAAPSDARGVRALYRGIAAPMAGVGLAHAAQFGVYGYCTRALTLRKQRAAEEAEADMYGASGHTAYNSGFPSGSSSSSDGGGSRRSGPPPDLSASLQNGSALSVSENIACATCSGVAASVAMTPFEVVKIRLQTESLYRHRRYYGALHCARVLWGQGGIRKLYRGVQATIARDVPGSVVYFGCYGELRKRLPQDATRWNIASILLAGGVAGVCQWLVVMPFDTVKTAIQTAEERVYIDWIHTWRTLYRTKGIGIFYLGLGPALCRAFAANASCFAGVEAALKMLDNPLLGRRGWVEPYKESLMKGRPDLQAEDQAWTSTLLRLRGLNDSRNA